MYSSTAEAIPAKKPGILINRNFALLWLGGAISVFGDFIFDTTLAVWIVLGLAVHQSWAPLAVSAVLLTVSLPTFVFGPIAGVFVDRWDKRRTMLWMDAIRAVLIGLMVLATNLVPLPFLPGGRVPLVGQLAILYSVVFLSTICSQFFSPARMALIRDVVEDPLRARATGTSQAVQMLALVIAPPLAPLLYVATGAQWAIGINALSFVASFLLVLAVRAPKSATSRVVGQRSNFLRDFFAGLRFAFHNRTIAALVASITIVMLGASTLNALDIFFALNDLHVAPALYGFLSAAMGFGSILGAILAATLAQRIGLVRTLGGSMVILSALLLAYTRMTSFVPALVIIGVGGIFQAGLNVAAGPLIMRVTPRAFMGRVSATINPAAALASMLGTVIAGYLAGSVLPNFHAQILGQNFDTFNTILGGGAVLTLLGAFFTVWRLGWRDPAPAEEPASEETASSAALVPDANIAVPTLIEEIAPVLTSDEGSERSVYF
jgi:MFS family permease